MASAIALFTSGNIILAVASLMAIVIFWALYRLQKTPGNGVDFFEFIRDNQTRQFDPVKLGYMTAMAAGTAVYLKVGLNPASTVTDITNFTLIYMGALVTSQAANRFAQRPSAPITNVLPNESTASSAQVSVPQGQVVKVENSSTPSE